MAETSRFWDGTTIGDATTAPYDAAVEFAAVQRSLSGAGAVPTNVSGVFNELNRLEVTGTVSPVTVDSGRALVDGTWYQNDNATTVAIATPGAATRIDRVVIRKSSAAQTARITLIAGVEGGSAPALVQVAGVTWDMPLAQASITTGGVITVTSERQFIISAGQTPMCIVGYSSAAVVAPIDPMPWDTDYSDVYGMHDPVTNNSRISIPIDGIYEISFVNGDIIDNTTVAGRVATVSCYKNGGRTGSDLQGFGRVVGYATGMTQPQIAFKTYAKLRKNEYVELVYANAEAGARIGSTNTNANHLGMGWSVKWVGSY